MQLLPSLADAARGIEFDSALSYCRSLGSGRPTKFPNLVGVMRSRVTNLLTCVCFAAPAIVTAQSVDSAALRHPNREHVNELRTDRASARESELPVSTLSQLLNGRFPGLEVMSGGATGTGSRIRFRGPSSLLLSNDPLIVLDGIRLYPAPNSAVVSVPSRNDDINVSDIASIELVSGVDATLRYGSGASNGVISIVTKRGVVGRPRFEFNTENGALNDPTTYNDLYTLWGKRTGTTASVPCRLNALAAGTCTADSLSHGNVMSIDSLKPIDVGYHNQYHARLSGGTPRFRYSVSGEFARETGVYKMPALEVQRLEVERGVTSLPDYQTRPSSLANNNVQANLQLNPFSTFNVQLTSAYIDGEAHLVPNEGQTLGIGYNAYGGAWNLALNDSRGVPLRGYAQYPAGDVMSQTVTQRTHRFINGAAAQFRPFTWLDVHGSLGLDDATQREKLLDRLNEGPQGGTRAGYVQEAARRMAQQSADLATSVEYAPAAWLSTRTTVGAQWRSQRDSSGVITGFGLPAGATSSAAAAQLSGSQLRGSSNINALFVAEVISVGDELFVSGGVRHDTPRYLGAKLASVNYPTAGASWIANHHGVLARARWLDTLRVRAGFSASGQFGQLAINAPGAIPLSGAANQLFIGATLPPERTNQVESGIDASLFHNATSIAFTFYVKSTRDGALPYQGAPSLGGFPSETAVNGMRVANRGIELSVQQRFVSSAPFSASLGVNAWGNRNRVISFPSSVPPVAGGDRSTQLNVRGYPLFGLWGRTYSYNDANHDGIIVASEMAYSDSGKFIASSLPTRELTAFPLVEFFNHKLRFTAQVDSKWGFKKFNNTLRHQCMTVASCRGVADRTASLESQAAVVAAQSAGGILTGFYEDASFVRLREASIVYELPARWAAFVRATSWNVVLTGRNLALHTKYTGTDPEAISSTLDSRSDEYFTTPPARYYLARINLVF